MFRRTLPFVAAMTIAFAMASSSSDSSGPLKGKVKKGIYYAPAANFSLPVPHLVGLHTTESYAPDSTIGLVSFADDFGKVFGIAYLRAHEQALAPLADTTRTYALIEEWIRLFAMPTFFSYSADSRLVRLEEIRLAGAPAALGLVNFPGGKTLAVESHGKTRSLDSRRGLMVFVRDGHVYMLYNETLPGGEALVDSVGALALDLDALVRAKLEPFYDTIQFSEGRKSPR